MVSVSVFGRDQQTMTRPSLKRGILVTLLSISLLAGFWLTLPRPATDLRKAVGPHAFSIVSWEVRNAPGKWLREAMGGFGQPALSPSAQQEVVREYIELSA